MANSNITEAVRAVSQFLITDASLHDTLDRIARISVDAIPGAIACGMSLLDENGELTTSVFTDAIAPDVDALQYRSGTGPCVDAFRERRTIRVDDITDPPVNWPKLVRSATSYGVRSVLSTPLLVGDASLGGMNLYGAEPNAFSEVDEDNAMLLTTQASVVLANASAYWTAVDLAENLRKAMESRAEIEQAKGKIMATNKCSADEAFGLLVKASQRENRKLRDIARRVLEGTPPQA